jgi:hypothetical protein
MRRLLILLLLAGCDSGAPEAELPQDGVAVPAAAAEAPGLLSPAQQAAQNRQRAAQALAAILFDPKSARYSDLIEGAAGAVCGRVDSRQADGKYAGPRPFVVTPEGVAVINTGTQVMFDDPEDIFPDFYIRWCASPEELRGIGPRIATAGGLPDVPAAAELAEMVEAAPAPPPTAEPPSPRESAKAPPPAQPGGDEDSFSRAVLRNRSEGAPR